MANSLLSKYVRICECGHFAWQMSLCMCSLQGTLLSAASAMTDFLSESNMQGLHCREHAMGHVEGSGGCVSNLLNQRERKLGNRANSTRQVAMLKRRAQLRDSVAHIQAQRDATSGQMAVHSRYHRTKQLPKLAAATCGRKQVGSELCHGKFSVLSVRIGTNAKVRTRCLEH